MAADSNAERFLRHCSYMFYWDDMATKTIMDIGCGKGNNSTRRLMEMYPNVKKVIAIDVNILQLDFAQRENRFPKVEYHEADIEEWSSVERWEGQIDIVLSHHCLNCVINKKAAFENIHKLLVSGGTAGVLFLLQADLFDWAKEVAEKFGHFEPNFHSDPPDTHSLNIPASSYKDLLFEIGFDVMQCDDEYITMTFATEEECKTYLCSICPVSQNIPSELMNNYIDEIFSMYLKKDRRNPQGLLTFSYRNASILLKKK